MSARSLSVDGSRKATLRVLILTQYYWPEVGAAQVRLQAVTRELVRQGHCVEIITAMPNYPTGRIFDGYRRKIFMREELDGATVRRVWAYPATGAGIRRILGYVTFALSALMVLLTSRRSDVVVVESPPLLTAIPAMANRILRHTPYVLITADLWPDVAVDMGLLRPGVVLTTLETLERRAYRSASRITAVTHGQIQTLTEDKGVPADKLVLMPNGVDPTLFGPGPVSPAARSALGGHDTDRIILYAGTHGHAHGMDVLLDAAPLVGAAHPEVRFVCVGGGSDRDRLIERARAEGISNVDFLEARPLEEIAELYRASWAGLSTLRPSKSLEAARPSKIFPIMASALPVIYSGDGEGAELVRSAGAGIVCRGGDHKALAHAVDELLGNPTATAEMGQRGREYICENLSWAQIVRSWIVELGSFGE